MNSHKNILQLPFLLLLFFSSVHAKNHCPTSYCGSNSTFPIRYPFKLHDNQPPNCSYIDLTCNDQAIATLNIPYSGDFYVREIDYDSFMIRLYDPGNCLPRRFMSFNLSSSYILKVLNYQNYTFYSCPAKLVGLTNLTVIDCLSNSYTATVATSVISSLVMKELYRCNEILTASIPVSEPDSYDFIGNPTDFVLLWLPFSCNGCSNPTGSNDILETAFIVLLLLTYIMPPLLCISCCVHFSKEVRSAAG